jgi:hypothetical protein
MFGEPIDTQITMLQRIVSLLRDLILGVTVVITCVIVYFGGDATKLNVLDWTTLVGAASLIVIGPIVAFFVMRLIRRVLNKFLVLPLSMFRPDTPIPTGFVEWSMLKIGRLSRQEYRVFWKRYKNLIKKHSERHPFIVNKVILGSLAGLESFFRIQDRLDPYLFAMGVLTIAVLVFRRIILVYVPN